MSIIILLTLDPSGCLIGVQNDHLGPYSNNRLVFDLLRNFFFFRLYSPEEYVTTYLYKPNFSKRSLHLNPITPKDRFAM